MNLNPNHAHYPKSEYPNWVQYAATEGESRECGCAYGAIMCKDIGQAIDTARLLMDHGFASAAIVGTR